MNTAERRIPAQIEMDPPVTITVVSEEDARRIATAMGCRILLYIEPASAERPTNVAAGSAAVMATPPPPEPERSISAPDRIRQWINEHPGRTIRATDFPEIGDAGKVGNVLHRMVEHGEIERVDRGEFRALRPPATVGKSASTGAQVIAYMREHPGEWLRAADVTTRLGLESDHKSAVAAALARQAKSGRLSRRGNTFCFLTRAARSEVQTP